MLVRGSSLICMRANAPNRIGVDACVGVARIDAYSIWGVSAHADQCVRVCVCGRGMVEWSVDGGVGAGVVVVAVGGGCGGCGCGCGCGWAVAGAGERVACVVVWGVAVRWWGW
jgi:hypothetical protein